jgi:hypothetical protein
MNGHSMTETALIRPDDFGFFGFAVDISGPYAVIGAYDGDNSSGAASGVAYVYYKDYFWSYQQKIESDDGSQSNRFGISVAIDNLRIVIGASSIRAAYVLIGKLGAWLQKAKLEPWNIVSHNYFGMDVGVNKNNIVVGAYYDDENGIDAGAAYTFRYDGSSWLPIEKILSSDGAEGDLFGYSVSITNDHYIVGAYGDQNSGNYTGSAYINCNYSDITQSVSDKDIIPNDYILYQNYPNPFNPTTKIKFGLKNAGHVIIEIYDILGRKYQA